MNMNINFPHLGIELEHVGRSISILGFHITYYGMLIGLALVAGIFITIYFAVKSRQNIEHYLDLVIGTVLWGVVGARIYYVLFSWDRYQGHFFRIFNLRQGGLAFYGALMAAVLFTVFYAKRKREKPSTFPLSIQRNTIYNLCGENVMKGYYKNEEARESFGGYTDGLFAMQLPVDAVRTADITEKMREHIVELEGISYIQVHPAFLYEMVWNLLILVLVLLYYKQKMFEGELFLIYIALYGIGRTWIEALRVDKLHLPFGNLPVSLIFAVVSAAVSIVLIIHFRKEVERKKQMEKRRQLRRECETERH